MIALMMIALMEPPMIAFAYSDEADHLFRRKSTTSGLTPSKDRRAALGAALRLSPPGGGVVVENVGTVVGLPRNMHAFAEPPTSGLPSLFFDCPQPLPA